MTDRRIGKPKDQTTRELHAELVNLRLACDQWELGFMQRSSEIARCLRVLLYDKGAKRSIFAQLNWKAVPFFTTASKIRWADAPPLRVLATKSVERFPAVPPDVPETIVSRWNPRYYRSEQASSNDLAATARWRGAPFVDWWREPIASNGVDTLSRCELVLAMSNELGATHSAERIRPATLALLNGDLDYVKFNVSFSGSNLAKQVQFNNLSDALIRQVAYETQRTVERHYAGQVPTPIVALPMPEHRRANPYGLRVEQDEAEVRAWLAQWEGVGKSETVIAYDVKSELYWHDRRREMRELGL